MSKNLNWSIIGTGTIADELATAFKYNGRKLYSVANRTYEKGLKFSRQYEIDKVYNKIDEVFIDPEVDVIYISTPHNTHIEYLRKALTNGKHVLCEKSITLNSDELNEAIDLANKNNVVLAEAMTIYHMPIYHKLNELIESNALGELKTIQVNFGSYKNYDMNNRFFSPHLAGGALLDIGVYALSFIRWFMSTNPIQITSQVKFAPSGVDEQANILLVNNKEEMASIALSLHAKQPKRGMVSFDRGYIEIYDFPRGDTAVITYTEDGSQEIIEADSYLSALQYEVSDMEDAILNGNSMYINYTKEVMDIMSELRKSWNLKYPGEN